jgi:ribosome-associated translation inhibitor RaiA
MEADTMQIGIQALGFPLTDALRERVKRRMGFALGGRDENIQRVEVRLSDINGPKGGKDMCCQIRIVLSRIPDVVIKDTETDLCVAIDRAFDRAGRSVARQLSRQLTKQRAPTPGNFELPEPN